VIEESDDLGCYLLFLFLNIDTLFQLIFIGLSDGYKGLLVFQMAISQVRNYNVNF